MKLSRLIIIVPILLVALQLMAVAPVNEAADKQNTVKKAENGKGTFIQI
jgi:hypothetical protein